MGALKGKVWLVGAGPGDPSLLTLGAKNALSQCDVIVYDALANVNLLKFAKNSAEFIYVGKIADQHAMPQSKINELLAQQAQAGANVARLKGGDPYIFGRGGEEAEYLFERNIPFEVIPGISSAIAAPAWAGIPLTHRDFVSSVSIITGHEKPEKSQSSHDWQAFVKSGSTLVFLMGMRNLPNICENLIKAGMEKDMPAAVIYRGATPMQRKLIATVADLPEKAAKANFTNPAVIVVGKVVNLSDKLDWYSKKPLLGKTIVITRAREQASDMSAQLKDLGAIVIECPTIKICPLDDYGQVDKAIDDLHKYKWLIFTSVNGVKYFWDRLAHNNRDSRYLGSCQVAAIGPATALALEKRGVRPDLVPETYVAESVAEALIHKEGRHLAGQHILLPRAARARSALPEELTKMGAKVDIAPIYETVPVSDCGKDLQCMLAKGEVDCIAFGSSSTVENFLSIVPAEELKKHEQTRLAAIGPITARTLQANGLHAQIQPQSYTIPGLVDAIVKYYSAEQ